MDKNDNEINEKIIFEALVKYKKKDVLLKLVNKNIILEKKKGVFKKKYKVIENVFIDDIKVIGDKIKIEYKKKVLKFSTNENEFEFVFENNADGRKLEQLIIEIKTGANLLERTSKRVIKISNVATKSAQAIGVASAAVVGTYTTIKKNKKAFIDAAKVVKNLLKK